MENMNRRLSYFIVSPLFIFVYYPLSDVPVPVSPSAQIWDPTLLVKEVIPNINSNIKNE